MYSTESMKGNNFVKYMKGKPLCYTPETQNNIECKLILKSFSFLK